MYVWGGYRRARLWRCSGRRPRLRTVRISTFLAAVGVPAGLFTGWLLAFAIYLQVNQSPGCDIPCDAGSGETVVSAVALIGAVVGGCAGRLFGRWLERRSQV